MQVTLEYITPDAEFKVAKYAAICYDSDTSLTACQRRMKHLMDVQHLATLRFAHAVFRVEGISRACANQFVRSKHLDFLQESQRYVNQADASFVWPPSLVEGIPEEIRQTQERIWKETYSKLIEDGYKKEDARCILPASISTKLLVVGNLQAWKDFLKLRTAPKAQWEIREVANEIESILKQECPNVFQ